MAFISIPMLIYIDIKHGVRIYPYLVAVAVLTAILRCLSSVHWISQLHYHVDSLLGNLLNPEELLSRILAENIAFAGWKINDVVVSTSDSWKDLKRTKKCVESAAAFIKDTPQFCALEFTLLQSATYPQRGPQAYLAETTQKITDLKQLLWMR
ncbi:hypothetical protein ARMSODRAFT_1021711 [Armillaria solidipes]|uniref:Uncharacterized protein n=1 Tax=Armillaria solidipes TaxID=1076256 RepID=A0A2H3B5G8_9AGAR|nr:hypothetical protein ARMSODRAFT_1021711 [Armillaria solidipes]